MCRVCVDWNKGKLTVDEAFKNLDELLVDIESDEDFAHYIEVIKKISDESDDI